MNKQSPTNASTKRAERAFAKEYLPNHPQASISVYQYNRSGLDPCSESLTHGLTGRVSSREAERFSQLFADYPTESRIR